MALHGQAGNALPSQPPWPATLNFLLLCPQGQPGWEAARACEQPEHKRLDHSAQGRGQQISVLLQGSLALGTAGKEGGQPALGRSVPATWSSLGLEAREEDPGGTLLSLTVWAHCANDPQGTERVRMVPLPYPHGSSLGQYPLPWASGWQEGLCPCSSNPLDYSLCSQTLPS